MPLQLPTFSVWAGGTLKWNDFRNQIALPPLPPDFPLPPDGDVRVEGSFNDAGEFRLCCALDFEIADEAEFAGVRFGRECRFKFCASATVAALSGGGPIAGEVFLEVVARLPELPVLPGVMELDIGNSSGWVRMRFHARADAGGALQLSAEILKPLVLRLQIPGMPQPEAPFQAELDQVALELVAASSGLTMKLELLGSFELHPFIPPIQLPVSQYLTPLFATLPELSGSCRLSLGVEGGRPTLSFDATLDNVEVDMDIVGMLRGLAAGLSNPQGSAAEVPLEIDFGFRVIGLSFALGGEVQALGGGPLPFAVMLKARVTLGSVEAVGGISITDQEFSFGIDRMVIPLAIPAFPITQAEFQRWYADPAWKAAIDAQIKALESDTSRKAKRVRSRFQIQKLLMEAVCTLRGDYNGADGYHMQGGSRNVYGEWLSFIFGALDQATSVVAGREDEARYRISTLTFERLKDELVSDTLLDALNALNNHIYDSENAFLSALSASLSPELLTTYKSLIFKCALIRGSTLRALIGGEEHHIFDDLSIILREVKFKVPFRSPRDIGVSGGAQFSGFVGPYGLLNEVELGLGLSADLIYFTIKTVDDTISIPDIGRYKGGNINFSEFRFGFGYTKRSLTVAFAGGVVLPKQLVDDLDTSDITAAGIRLPVQMRLSFRFELMPAPVIKVMPLFQFNLDLRQNYSPGLADSSRCIPYWDGLQVIVPGIIHVALKHLAFSPIFAILPALNWAFDGDFVLGDEHNGYSLIIDDLLGIDYIFTGTAFKIPIPGLAGDSPFCENYCMSLRVAGFAVNFNVQRPFPSFSPLALFELLALLSDPEHYHVDPHGELANSLRVTLKDAYVVLPEGVRRYFPDSAALVRQPHNITINLADYLIAAQQFIAIARPIVTAVIDAVKQGADDAGNIPARLEQCRNDLANLNWRKALTCLPAELHICSQHALFAGFNADTTVVLMTRDEALDELKRRGKKPSAQPVFKSLGPGKPFNLKAFGSLMFKLPAPSGTPRTYDRNDPANNAFAGPAFTGLTTRLLKELLPTADEMVVIVAARVQVINAANQFIGYLSSSGAFKLVTTSDIDPFALSVAGLTVALPLQFHGRMELSGDARGGAVQASVDAVWDVFPGVLKLILGMSRKPLFLRVSSDGRFALKGPAQAQLFNRNLAVVVDITETHCLIETPGLQDIFVLDELAKVRARVRGQVGPQMHFSLDGQGKIIIFGKTFDITEVKLDERRLELGTRLILDEWRLPNGKAIPCAVNMRLQGGVDFRDPFPNFALAGEGDLALFGKRDDDGNLVFEATLSGVRGGVRYQSGQLALFAEGVLHWHGHEWLNARIELGPDGVLIQGRVALPFDEIKPPGFTVGMTAVLNIFTRLKLDLTSGNLLDMEARGDWLLGISLPNTEDGKPHILPLACNRLPELTAPQLPYRLVEIGGFPVPKIKDFDLNIPVPSVEGANPININLPDSVTLPEISTPNSQDHHWWIMNTDHWFGKQFRLLTEAKYDLPDVPDNRRINLNHGTEQLSIFTRFAVNWGGAPQFPLPFERLPGFSLWLVWNPEKKRFELSSDAKIPPPLINIDYDPVGNDILGEYIELRNTADIDIDLTGWRLHDSADYTHAYTLPFLILRSGATVKIWTKEGINDEGNLFWGLKHAVWNNVGDEAVLKDARGGEVTRFSYRKG